MTPQSLATFAGASTAVTLFCKVSGLVHQGWDQNHGVALVCALLIGAVLYFISETDPNRGPITTRDYAIDGIVALINTLVLFTAAIGVTQVAPTMQGGGSPSQEVSNAMTGGHWTRCTGSD